MNFEEMSMMFFYILQNKFWTCFILGDNRLRLTPSLRQIHCTQEKRSPNKLQIWSQQNLSGQEICICDVRSHCDLYKEQSQLFHRAFTGATQQRVPVTGIAKDKPVPRNSQPKVSAPTLQFSKYENKN
jgi:hypothetical protein